MRFVAIVAIALTWLAESKPAVARENEGLEEVQAAESTVTHSGSAPGNSREVYSPIRTGKTRFGWTWLAEHFDKDQSGNVTRQELSISSDQFKRLDRTWDGILSADDFDWSAEGALCRQKETTFALFKSADTNSDGRLTADELQLVFKKFSKDKDYLDEEDLETLMFLPRVLKSQNEFKSRAKHITFQFDDLGKLPTNLPEPGMIAPDFDLSSTDKSRSIKLSSFQGKKPVVLIFGCLSCGNYRTYSETLEMMYHQHKNDVEFLRVYVREAHPVGAQLPTETNAKAGFLIQQPTTLDDRCKLADRCARELNIKTPFVVDGLDNRVGQAYGGWPDRLYIIDINGKVAYQGGPGPFAFNPREMEQSLLLLLLERNVDKVAAN